MLRWLLLLAFACCPLTTLHAQDRPLVMDGKQTLYQRVLVRERTVGTDQPDGSLVEEFVPLTPLYVYARDGDWLQVGRGQDGEGLAWIPAEAAVDWRQNIVVTFESTENVGRLLFFADLDSLYDVVESESPARVAAHLREEAQAAEAGGQALDRIVALGPREGIDLRQNLYVMPILDHEEALFENGSVVNLLKVAVARADPDGSRTAEAPVPLRGAEREDFRAAVVFVVDTTISMQRFIDATRDALAALFDRVSASEAGDAVHFGLIGFRDHPDAEATEDSYAVQTFVSLADGPQAERFLAEIRSMEEAELSNRHFREDSYAGIEHALVDLDWTPYDARWIVLITDAGPREVGDEFSQTGLSGSGIASLVQERLDAAIAVLHLRTPEGESDHVSAEQAYRELARSPNQEPLYFPINDGETAAYGDAAGRLAELIVEQVIHFRDGTDPNSAAEGNGDFMTQAVLSAGRTMQLAYLGRVEGTRAPDVFEAYVADRDFERTGLKPLSIRLLLTKNQLSDLEGALKLIIEQAEANVINPDEFFQQVLAAAADMSRRPEDVALRGSGASLAEAAAISEYLEGLPYVSRIMNITEDDWIRMSIAEQQTVVNELYDKIARYRRYNEATDQWVDYLGTGGGSDTLVYPMKLDDLP